MDGNGLVTGLIGSTAPRLPRLSDVLFPPESKRFDSIAALPSNVRAIESTQLFASRRVPFVALVGPSGWGKSHLLASAAERLHTEFLDSADVREATQWATNPGRHDPTAPLLLDNVQDLNDKGRLRTQFRLAIERRVRAGRPTLLSFTAGKQNRTVRSFLPNYKDWIVCGIHSPDPAERELVVRHMATAEGLTLSDELVWLLGHRIHGNGRTLLGALKRLRLNAPIWNDPANTLKACGVLTPFFADNSSWDLRDHIVSCEQEFAGNFIETDRTDLCVFAMLRVACLAEADIASFFEIEPAGVYNRAALFGEKVASCEVTRNQVLLFIRYVVGRLNTA